MLRTPLLIIALLLFAVPLDAQVAPEIQTATGASRETEMLMPPPVSGRTYPIQYRSEIMQNYLLGRVSFDSSYVDNLYAGSSLKSISETTLTVLPTLTFDRTSSLQHFSFTYSPGYTFYRPTSDLNQLDQNAVVTFQRSLSPHTVLSLNDQFVDSSTAFGYLNPAAGSGIQGVPVNITPGLTPPFTQRLSNVANGVLTVQTGMDTMIGVSGVSTLIHYPNPFQTTGLFDGTSRGGGGFYSHRFTRDQYGGLIYQFMDMLTDPSSVQESTTQTHDFSGFYTVYLANEIPLSVVAGSQYYKVTQASVGERTAWSPAFAASIGWQGSYASYALRYSQSVTGAGGLLGAFRTKDGMAAMRWRLAPNWSTGISGSYANNHTVDSAITSNVENGHTLTGSIMLEHSFSPQLGVRFQFDHLHASYSGIPSFQNNPDSNRGTVSLWWQFTRPLGR